MAEEQRVYFASSHLGGYSCHGPLRVGAFRPKYKATSSFMSSRHIVGKGVGTFGVCSRLFNELYSEHKQEIEKYYNFPEIHTSQHTSADDLLETDSGFSSLGRTPCTSSGQDQDQVDEFMPKNVIERMKLLTIRENQVAVNSSMEKSMKRSGDQAVTPILSDEIIETKVSMTVLPRSLTKERKSSDSGCECPEENPNPRKMARTRKVSTGVTTSEVCRRERWKRSKVKFVRSNGQVVVLLSPLEYDRRLLQDKGMTRGITPRRGMAEYISSHNLEFWF